MSVSHALLPAAALLAVFASAVATNLPSISHFNLIDARVNKVMRRLKNRDHITVTHPFTIYAVPANKSGTDRAYIRILIPMRRGTSPSH